VLKAFLRKKSTHDRVQTLIRQGVGVHETTWALTDGGGTNDSEDVVQQILDWVRESMSLMRRPYGIDHVALALACRDGSGNVLSSSSLGVIRPASFYGEDGRNRIAGFLSDVRFVGERKPAQVAGALLSLGDLAFELSLAQAA
jgi:hypothetical protein